MNPGIAIIRILPYSAISFLLKSENKEIFSYVVAPVLAERQNFEAARKISRTDIIIRKISGGKVLSSKIPKGSNPLKIALRNAANAIGNLKASTR
jgi:hypothetical protein